MSNPTQEGQKVKPILLEHGEKAHKRVKLQWDEQGISEYDKERGHHMIISEPKTPYHPPPGMEPKDEEEEAINPNDLAYKLELQKRVEEGDEKSIEELERIEEEKRRKEFERKRKAHYNEGVVLKEWKKIGVDEIEDDNTNGK